MNALSPNLERDQNANEAAQRRLLALPGEPLFYSDWVHAVFIHYEVDAEHLQASVPYPLDTHSGHAYVSLVAFAMRNLHPRLGGKPAAWLFAPIATHELLNLRTYVRDGNETGIFFLAEWIPNRLSAWLGPRSFGLPYRLGRLQYQFSSEDGGLRGTVTAGSNRFTYEAKINPDAGFCPAETDSLDEFLLERFTAFTVCGSRRKFFRIWHTPWPQQKIDSHVTDDSLVRNNFPWFAGARLIGANYSPGVSNVWMGWPHAAAVEPAELRRLQTRPTIPGRRRDKLRIGRLRFKKEL